MVLLVVATLTAMFEGQWILGAGLAIAVGILEWARLKDPAVEERSFRIQKPKWRRWFLCTWAAATVGLGVIFAASEADSLAVEAIGAVIGGAFGAGFVMWLLWTNT